MAGLNLAKTVVRVHYSLGGAPYTLAEDQPPAPEDPRGFHIKDVASNLLSAWLHSTKNLVCCRPARVVHLVGLVAAHLVVWCAGCLASWTISQDVYEDKSMPELKELFKKDWLVAENQTIPYIAKSGR